ncbi:MAG: ribonuclease E/G, partial [Myxococcota bacterium]
MKSGQEVLVQVQKEPMGTKGARLTRQITVPGRNLVYMPFNPHIGVSRRIENAEERERLREVMQEGSGEVGGGFIVRTAAEGLEADKL